SNVRIDSLALFVNTGTGDVAVPPADYTVTPALPDTGLLSVSGRHFKLVYKTRPTPFTTTWAVVARDRNGLSQRTDVTLLLDGQRRSGGAPIADNDEVPPNAALSFLLISPAPIPDPLTQVTLTINGASQAFAPTPAGGDVSGREWILTWGHADYPIDNYTVVVSIQTGGTLTRPFRVTAGSSKLAIQNLFPFPNPFDSDGTHFSFFLTGTENADVKLHVFSQSGKSIYTAVVKGLNPG